MIEQRGRVIATEKGRASVRIGGTTGCSACDAGRGCGAGIFGRLLQRRPVTIELENEIDAECGNAVILGLPESIFLRLVLRLYLAPLLAGLAGAVAGHYMSGILDTGTAGSDVLTLVGAIVGGAVIVLRNRRKTMEFPDDSAVHLLRIAAGRNLEKEEEVFCE